MAARFFVGNGTAWSSTASWSATDGGASGVSVPTNADDVKLTALSPGNLTIDVAASCLTFDCTGFTHTLTHNAAVTLTVSGTVFKLVSTMVYTRAAITSALAFIATSGTVLITTGGLTLGNVWTGPNAASTAIYQLQDACTTAATATWNHQGGGTLDTNGKTCTWGSFDSSNVNTRTLTFGSSNISIVAIGTPFTVSTNTGLTVTAGTYTITFTNISGVTVQLGAKSWNNIVANGGGRFSVGSASGVPTIANLTYTGTATQTCILAFNGNTIITGTLTITPNSITNSVVVQSGALGTPSTVTAGALVATSRVDFMDITGAGAATWTTAASGATAFGDCLGNSGITFTTPVTRYAVVAGNWSSTATWSATSGGAGGQTVPLPQDTVNFDANSAAGTYVADMPRLGKDINCTGFTRTLNFTSLAVSLFGNFTLSTTMTFSNSQNISLCGRSAQTWTTGGKSFSLIIFINAPGGGYTLQDNPTLITTIQHQAGLFADGGRSVIHNGTLQSNSGITRTLTLTGTWTPVGNGPWTLATAGLTANLTTSTVIFNFIGQMFFAGGGLNWGSLWVQAGNICTFQQSNSFQALRCDQGGSLQPTNGTTQTVAAGGLTLNGQNYGYQRMMLSTGNLVTTPSSTALSPTADFTFDMKLAADSWASGATTDLMTKWNAAGTLGWAWLITATGTMQLYWSWDGTNWSNVTSSIAIGFAAHATGWVRVSFHSAAKIIRFHTSTDGITWTQLGIDQTTVATSTVFANGTIPVEIGTQGNGTAGWMKGVNLYRAKVYKGSALDAGSGIPDFDADFSAKAFGANSFVESSANAATVTMTGLASRGGDGRWQIASNTPGSFASISVASGTVSADYGVVQDSHAIGGATFYAGPNSKNVSNNTGWIFNAPPIFSTAADSWAISDSAVIGLRAFSRTVSDSFVISESASRISSKARTASDLFSIADSTPSDVLGVFKSAADSWSFSESPVRALNLLRAISDSFSISDAVVQSSQKARTAADVFSISDITSRITAAFRITADSWAVSDSPTRLLGISRAAGDSFSVSDIAGRQNVAYARSASEIWAISDAALRIVSRPGRSASDVFVISDSPTRLVGRTRSSGDAFSISDSPLRSLLRARSAADSFSISDAAVQFHLVAYTSSDVFSMSDVATRRDAEFRITFDVFGISDTTFAVGIRGRRANDSWTISDFAAEYVFPISLIGAIGTTTIVPAARGVATISPVAIGKIGIVLER
jgi:hypothetical protein